MSGYEKLLGRIRIHLIVKLPFFVGNRMRERF